MMNSAEEIATYHDDNSHYCSPILARKNANTYNVPEKSPKKDKKWSLGNLFRRKKKESDSTSDDEGHRNFLQRKKKKSDKRKRVTQALGFDHVVVRQSKHVDDPLAVFSEPTPQRNFIPASDFATRCMPLKNETARSNQSLGSPSVCSLGRRKKVHVKARAEARRDNSKGEESSDDDSQLSMFRSDESLTAGNRRSRAARTKRYLRRMSKDDDPVKVTISEAQQNLKNLQQNPVAKPKLCYTSSAPAPIQRFSGLTTIPPSHNRYVLPNKYLSYHTSHGNGMKTTNELNDQRSLSCESNVFLPNSPESNYNGNRKYPPPPPPRDPRRVIAVPNGDARPMSYSFENGYKRSLTEQKHDVNHNFLHKNLRSTSEDHISNEPLQRIPLIPRPSSATPDATRLQKLNQTENQNFRYLTDKNPRSRRPICIQPDSTEQPTWSQKTFNFWRKKDEELVRNRKSTTVSPLIFTAQTHVTTSIFPPPTPPNEPASPFRPIASSPERKSSNLEDALCELEAIYNSLHLGDEELLDRAEERETAVANDSGFGFDPNYDSTRKQRRSKRSEPNIKTDDMAFRKLNRPRFNTINHPQTSISYLLASPVFNGSVEALGPSKGDEPDTTLDDVVFRNVMRTNNSLKVVEPQPPFGIPMGPISPASNSDYLHIAAEPVANGHKKTPDVVKDDLAYRSLRKDPNKAAGLPPYHINDEVDGFKKKRAVRSLSANIGSLMHPTVMVNHDQNITDVADALEMARQILRDKEEKINATRQAFMSDGELKYRRFDSRSPNDHRLDSKPPTSDRRNSKTSKESTPTPSDNSEFTRQLRQSTLDELLTNLAVETRENSDKITEELNAMDSGDKLLQCVNNELFTEELEVAKIEPVPEIVANVVLLPTDRLDDDPVAIEVFSESDHDYVNVQSAEERAESKDDLLAAFEAIDETLRKMTTKETEGGEIRHSRPCDILISSKRKMSQQKSTRAERMAQYKEERRKQLASQFAEASVSEAQASAKRRPVVHSSSDEPRTTRASRLRAAATSHEEKTSQHTSKNGIDAQRNLKIERDKSSKRKSNLNRALNSEEVPQPDSTDDYITRRRRRRFFPPEVLQQASSRPSCETPKCDNVSTASPTTAISLRTSLKKSELSIHMENARKGQRVSYSDMGKISRASPKKSIDSIKSTNVANKENITVVKQETPRRSVNVSKRMDELTALTQDTLARVERLAVKSRDTNMHADPEPLSSYTHSILKKKEEATPSPPIISNAISGPISILKRKVSLDQSGTPPTATPPVTFSPNVVDPATNRRRQGILKKRRSLDESQVLRHRSCSPEMAVHGRSDSRSILKNQRRSSLEEILRSQSPESGLHSILKRRSSRLDDETDPPINSPEPQGILKRRSGSSSAGSITHTSHVSIATAVILAAAGGAEMVLESNETVRPILKKRSFSEDQSAEPFSYETPKPILKKKSSTDTDDGEDKPKKPILKNCKNSTEDSDVSESLYRYGYQRASIDEGEVKPILKQGGSRESSPRPRLSFCANDCASDSAVSDIRRRRNSRRAHTLSADFSALKTSLPQKHEDRELCRPRPLSVCDMVLNIEKRLSTGAIPKTKRNSERHRTQPVTYRELEASRNSLPKPLRQDLPTSDQNVHSLLDLTAPLDTESNLSSSLPNTTLDSGISVKMSSDSAFQSLGDGLELENEPSSSVSPLHSAQGKLQMKALAEEAKGLKLRRAGAPRGELKASTNRFSTQPITMNEVKEAKKLSVEEDDSTKDETVNQKERKGILKSKLDFSQVSARVSPRFQESLKSVLKKSEEVKRLRATTRSDLRSILKPESSDFALDEGISSDDSQSGSEVEGCAKNGSDDSASVAKKCGNGKVSSSDDPNQTSDGDSSGGREVRSIIEGAEWSSRKRHRERLSDGVLCKSKSQGLIRDEEEIRPAGIRRSLTNATMPQKIAELQAKLQQSGDSDWRKRIPKLNNVNEELSLLNVKNIYNEELTDKTSILAARKDELDAASRQWRNRVEQSDALNFSVAGRMQQENYTSPSVIPINIPPLVKSKRTPPVKSFKGKEGGDCCSLPSSPQKNGSSTVKRSISMPGSGDTNIKEEHVTSRTVQIERPDNITYTSFFESLHSERSVLLPDISVDDFDAIARQSSHLLGKKRTVRVQRRREATKNPIKALAARPDITNEYTEVITRLAEKEVEKLNIEKISKSSNFAIEALAGLASKEDFSSIALKRSSSLNSTYPPFTELMLLQVKGRRFVQTRLVEPIASSINEGDCYILITSNAIYNYVGAYANVIEQSRCADIVNSIQQRSDLGCKCEQIVTINSKKISSGLTSDIEKFWKLLGAKRDEVSVAKAGHPDEDEIYETSILGTNMIYEYRSDELVPLDVYWGAMPKIEMLSPFKTFVFDFGSEMYVWSGKSALIEEKKKALRLARELWNEGYDYTDCGINPFKVAQVLGARHLQAESLSETHRPKWALFAKLTQHTESVLFKEKFVDWPDYSRVIRVKPQGDSKQVEAKFDFTPCQIEESKYAEPDLVADGMHLGRGVSYYDAENMRMFNFTTRSVVCWVILDYSHEELPNESVGQFHDGNSYIVRWEYCANTTGRGLGGQPSKFMQSGRDACLYFCWQGANATVNEKGAAALLTVQLDSENARQIRVIQGAESPVFLNLFKGNMVIHSGKHEKPHYPTHRLYICRGEMDAETFLTEVPCSMRSLRSRSCYILVSCKTGQVTVWKGTKSSSQSLSVTRQVAEKIVEKRPREFELSSDCDEFSLNLIEEHSETKEFLQALGGEKRQLYVSLSKNNEVFDYTPRLFHLSGISGKFKVNEHVCPHRSQHATPYPCLQTDLYSSSQPALFMFDNKHEVWLWHGWWPEVESDSVLTDQTGSGAIRWQEERKAAMQTVINYCRRDPEGKKIPAYLVWAGLEPLAFTNLFPFWSDYDEVSKLNMQDGRKPGEIVPIEKEIALITRSCYPLDQLLQRPLPDGVDPTHLENYLSAEDFSELMSMTLDDFQKLPTWKQTSVKKEKGLF